MRGSTFENLPDILPIFPLPGVLLLPHGQLPLNVFEPRYLAMVDDALKTNRLIGMIQPKEEGGALYETGCAGRMTSLTETDDNRYLITLTGISRFKIREELPLENGYRRVKPDWTVFPDDLKPTAEKLDIDRAVLKDMLQAYFDKEGLSCDWESVDGVPDGRLMTCLAMVCPFSPQEKQVLLEAKCCAERAQQFMTLLKIAIHGGDECSGCH